MLSNGIVADWVLPSLLYSMMHKINTIIVMSVLSTFVRLLCHFVNIDNVLCI